MIGINSYIIANTKAISEGLRVHFVRCLLIPMALGNIFMHWWTIRLAAEAGSPFTNDVCAAAHAALRCVAL